MTKFDQWDQPFPHAFEQAIAALDQSRRRLRSRRAVATSTPTAIPIRWSRSPLYGRWPALVDRVLTAPDGTTRLPNAQNWIHRLNLDPRFRVAAGLGTDVVQSNDQKYMAAPRGSRSATCSPRTRVCASRSWRRRSPAAMHETHVASLEPSRAVPADRAGAPSHHGQPHHGRRAAAGQRGAAGGDVWRVPPRRPARARRS